MSHCRRRLDCDALPTDCETETGVFDVDTRDDISACGKHRGSYGEVGVWNISVLRCNTRRVDQLLPGFRRYYDVACSALVFHPFLPGQILVATQEQS